MIETTSHRPRRIKLLPLPRHLRLIDDPWVHHRGVALAVILVVITAMSLFWAVALPLMAYLLGVSLQAESFVAQGMFVLLSIQTLVYYRYGNVKLSAAIFSHSYFILMLSLVIGSGGYDSALLLFLLCCTTISFRIGSREDGIMNAVFVSLAGLALVVMKEMGLVLPNMLQGIDRPVLLAIVWVVSLVIFSSCLATYHYRVERRPMGARL